MNVVSLVRLYIWQMSMFVSKMMFPGLWMHTSVRFILLHYWSLAWEGSCLSVRDCVISLEIIFSSGLLWMAFSFLFLVPNSLDIFSTHIDSPLTSLYRDDTLPLQLGVNHTYLLHAVLVWGNDHIPSVKSASFVLILLFQSPLTVSICRISTSCSPALYGMRMLFSITPPCRTWPS